MVLYAPDSDAAAAYRTLRARLQLSHREQAWSSLLITSPSSRSTKDLVAANLGIALAQARLRVVLVDADLDRPSLHRLLDTRSGPGLRELLARAGDWRPYVTHTDVVDLDVIPAGLPAGVLAGEAPGLLSSARLPWLIRQLENRYDVVLVHGSPALETVDAVALSAQASAAILVIESRYTLCKRAVEALTLLRNARVMVLGAVLTRARALAGDAHPGLARAGSTPAPVGAAEERPNVEPEPEASPGLGSRPADHSSDYAAAYLRQSERAGLQGGLLCVASEPRTHMPVEPRFREPAIEPQSEPIDFVEGHLVTLEELFIEPSVSAD